MSYGLSGGSPIDGKACSMTRHWRVRLRPGALIALVAALLCSVSTSALSAGGTIVYSYDALGRLTAVQYPTGVVITYALDAAGNRTSVTTTQPPNAPGVPVISSITGSTATASWTAPSGGTAPTAYQYSLNGGAIWTSTGTALSASLSGLAVGTPYTIAVQACDAEGGCGPQSSATFRTAPSAPGAVTITNVAGTTATASWGAATDSGGVAGYEYSLNGGTSWTNVGSVLNASLTGLAYATQYTFSVRAYDSVGTRGGSSSGTFTTLAKPAPSTPTGLITTVAGNNQVNLSWNASTESGSGATIAGYTIYRNGTQVGTSTSTSFSDTGVAPFNTYTYTVAAYDTLGTASGQSGSSSASTFYTITNSNGASTSSLYITGITIYSVTPTKEWYWWVDETYGSKTMVVRGAATPADSLPGACEYSGTQSIASGYERNGCIIEVEPSAYGH